MIGQLLAGRYQIITSLGVGGMAQTFIAEDIHRPNKPKCVVKQLKPIQTKADFLATARNLFEREAHSLYILGENPQIPRLLAHFEQNQEFYLVQEYIEGHTLSAEMQPGQKWNQTQVVQLLVEVLRILKFVHGQNVIHRDIKPDNIIRRPDGSFVLIDFGAVKQVKEKITTAMTPIASIAVGTYGYMPTEQAQGKPRHNSDIYALGKMGIQALTGLLPIQFPEDPQTGEIIWENFTAVDPGLAAVLNKMVRYHFKDRYQCADEALYEVEQIATSIQQSEINRSQTTVIRRESIFSNLKTASALRLPQKSAKIVTGVAAAMGLIALGGVALSNLPFKSAMGGDRVLDVGVITIPQRNPESNYTALAEYIESQLGGQAEVKFDFLSIEAEQSLETARQKIINQEWDVAFTTVPMLSITAVENDYQFAARMFPEFANLQSALFVRRDSSITSMDDLDASTKIALGGFNHAAVFYMPIYDLYGKTVSLDLNNNLPTIIEKVKSGQADVGVGIYPVIKQQENDFRIISVSRNIPLSGVYISSALKPREQELVQQLLLDAPEEIKSKINYDEGNAIDYQEFSKITRRVENIIGCTNLNLDPVQLFCSDNLTNGSSQSGIVGQVNGFESNADTLYLRLQSDDGKVYGVILPRRILKTDSNLPQPAAMNGRRISVSSDNLSADGLELQITQPGQITFLP